MKAKAIATLIIDVEAIEERIKALWPNFDPDHIKAMRDLTDDLKAELVDEVNHPTVEVSPVEVSPVDDALTHRRKAPWEAIPA